MSSNESIMKESIPVNSIPVNSKPDDSKQKESKPDMLLRILNSSNIICNSISELEGLIIPREVCLDNYKYNQIKTNEFSTLKTVFSSSYLTSLQSSALSKQKWPLLNLIRQLLLSCNFKLTPKRVNDGYTEEGVKKYKRMFIIEKMKI
jgi:hypothetical protein